MNRFVILMGTFFLYNTNIIVAQKKSCIYIGTSKSEIFRIQGPPQSVQKHFQNEVWSYGRSTVSFENGIVTEYANSGNNLKICTRLNNKKEKTIGEIIDENMYGNMQSTPDHSTASKSSTESWILQKLNDYTSATSFSEGSEVSQRYGIDDSYHEKNVHYRFLYGNLIINLIKVVSTGKEYFESYQIPLDDLKSIYTFQGKLSIETHKESIIEESYKTSLFKIGFDEFGEKNLLPRLVSAFAHLQKFYVKTKQKEAF